MIESDKFDVLPFELNNNVPLYTQLASHLRSLIRQKIYAEGETLPTELALCEKLKVSRSTVRRALSILEDEGLVLRIHGKGTIVCKPKFIRHMNGLTSLTEELNNMGVTTYNKLLFFKTIIPSPSVASELQISASDHVFCFCRVRYANGTPLLMDTVYLPVHFCPSLTENDVLHSVYAYLSKDDDTRPMEAVERYSAICLNPVQASQLEVEVGTPSFYSQRWTKNSRGEILEYSRVVMPAENNQFEISLKSNKVAYKRFL